MRGEKALLLLSGGQDSVTAAVWAQREGYDVEGIIFDYGQRHRVEIACAKAAAKALGIPVFVKKVREVMVKTSALTNPNVKLKMDKKSKLPTSFVPGRNLIFLTIAAAEAYTRDISVLITGVSQEDYSGYPDCRMPAIKALQESLSWGLARTMKILTPWMFVDKVAEIQYLVNQDELEILKYSHTCYNGVKGGCGKCPSCKIRAAAFKKAGFTDPIKKKHR